MRPVLTKQEQIAAGEEILKAVNENPTCDEFVCHWKQEETGVKVLVLPLKKGEPEPEAAAGDFVERFSAKEFLAGMIHMRRMLKKKPGRHRGK